MTNAQATEKGEIDDWMAWCTYFAWRRESGSQLEYGEWLDRFEGSEFESDEEDDEGESSPAE